MDNKLKLLIVSIVLMCLLVAVSGCTSPTTSPVVSPSPAPQTIRLATTTSTYDTGLLDALLPPFERANNVKIEVLSRGSGEAMKLGETGDVDVLMVHSPAAELTFMNGSHGWNRTPFMHNDYVIVGPKADPAGIKGMNSTEAFKTIYAKGSTFLARGDNSGTSNKSIGIWKKTGLTPDNQSWFKSTGLGMADTLRMTNEMSGYTIADRGTWYAYRQNLTELTLLCEGDKDLLNPYSIIAVNPEQHSNVNYAMAKKLIDFVSSAEGQAIIKNYGMDKYGQPLFFPDIIK